MHHREFVNWVLENQKVDGNFSKKIFFGDEAHFQLDGYVNTQKLSDLGRRESSNDSWKAIACTTSHCLVRILGWRIDWAVLFRKWGRKCRKSEWRTLSQHDNGIFVASIGRYGYGRHVVPVGRRNLSHCARNNWVVVRKMSWPCHLTQCDQNWPRRSCDLTPCDFFVWWFVKSRVYANKPQKFLSSRWIFDVSLAKLSRHYAEMSSRVSSKEKECASRVVGDIYRILCSTINHSVCTFYWNKTISTFLINGAFYYKINSCAFVGTPYTLSSVLDGNTPIYMFSVSLYRQLRKFCPWFTA